MKISLIISLPLALAFAVGCGSSKIEYPAKVFPVTGQVTWQGQPVASADVTFFNPETNRSAFGRTNEDGRYEMTTFAANDGAVAGRQVVTVSKIEAIVDANPIADVDSPDYVPPSTTPVKKMKKPQKPKALIPEQFSSANSSPLTVTVEESKKNVADLKLD